MQNDALTHSTSVPVQEELCEALDLSLPKKKGRDKEKCKWVLDSGYEGSLLMEVDEIEDDTPLIEVEQDEDEEEECWIEDANRSFHLGEDWDQHSVSHIAIPSPPAGTCFSPLDPNDTLLIDDQGIPYTLTPDGQKDPQGLGQRRILYCQYCPRVFYYLSDLERHSITHSQNKPHVCQLCGKAFKRSSHLERHKHIHTGQRNFVCQLCPRRFREAAELTRHQRVHTGEKPFQCLLCHMRFAERNTLRRHTKRKHQGQQQEAMNMKVKLETEGVSALGVQGQQEENINLKKKKKNGQDLLLVGDPSLYIFLQ
uniref:C2H2-type domain-containing protein n=1 Tax=Astyanax mexicanus TaxID=7994 RepID=A0A3B1K0M8_ASTMX